MSLSVTLKVHLACRGVRVRVEHFSPYPYPMMLTRTSTQPVPKIATQPNSTRGYALTRSLPVGLPLLGIIGLVAYPPRPGPLHCISSDESISVVENICPACIVIITGP